MKIKHYKGSYTVEATLILGTILTTIFSVLYLSFTSYDRLQLSFLLRETALWGAAKIEQGELITEENLISMAKDHEVLLLNMKNVVFYGEIKESEIRIWYTAKAYSLGGKSEVRKFEVTNHIHRPENFLRISHFFIGKEN